MSKRQPPHCWRVRSISILYDLYFPKLGWGLGKVLSFHTVCHFGRYNHLELTTDQSELPALRQCYVSDIMEYRYLTEL